MEYRTDEEKFWKGEFGDAYIDRNDEKKYLPGDIAFFSEVLKKTKDVKHVIEFGSNIGLNLKAIRTLLPSVKCSAIEINHRAASILAADEFFEDKVNVYETSILDYVPDEKADFVLIKGVLIHINPDELKNVYSKLYESSSKYICMAEYYNPTPVMVEYRGYENRLYKRDFAGEFMDLYPDVRLIDYGFLYHRDNNFIFTDVTWFLMEK